MFHFTVYLNGLLLDYIELKFFEAFDSWEADFFALCLGYGKDFSHFVTFAKVFERYRVFSFKIFICHSIPLSQINQRII